MTGPKLKGARAKAKRTSITARHEAHYGRKLTAAEHAALDAALAGEGAPALTRPDPPRSLSAVMAEARAGGVVAVDDA